MTEATTVQLVESLLEDAPSISAPTRQAARRLLADVLAVSIAGSATAEGQVMLSSIAARAPAGPCGVAVSSARLTPETAALVNGTMGYSIGLTDTHAPSITHPGPSVVPAALAVGEAVGAPGERILDAITLGVDLVCRVGKAVNPSHRQRGFHPTATCNHFGAALAASYLLGASRGQALSALGIAGSLAGGLYEFRHAGSMLMALHGGWPAHGGIYAANLAASGFTGPVTVLEGSEGFLRAFSDNPRPSALVRPAGSGWLIHELSMRPYCACRYAHPAIDALGHIAARRPAAYSPPERITVWLHRTAIDQESEPTTLVSARLSTAFNVALAAMHGPRLYEPTEADLGDTALRDLMQRIELVEDPALTAVFPRRWSARVRAQWPDGSDDTEQVDIPKGDPENPMADFELDDKFIRLTEPILGADRSRALLAAVSDPATPARSLWELAAPATARLPG